MPLSNLHTSESDEQTSKCCPLSARNLVSQQDLPAPYPESFPRTRAISPLVSYDQEAAPSDKSQLDLSGFAMSPQSPWLPDDTLELKELAAPQLWYSLSNSPSHRTSSTARSRTMLSLRGSQGSQLLGSLLPTEVWVLPPRSYFVPRSKEIRIGVAPLPSETFPLHKSACEVVSCFNCNASCYA